MPLEIEPEQAVALERRAHPALAVRRHLARERVERRAAAGARDGVPPVEQRSPRAVDRAARELPHVELSLHRSSLALRSTRITWGATTHATTPLASSQA